MSVPEYATTRANRVTFEPGHWGALNQKRARELALDPMVKPRALRVKFAAEGWANRLGHAEFGPGRLAEVLADPDPETGEMVKLRPQAVSKAVNAAKAMGLVGDSSGSRCLVVDHELFQKQGTGGASCGYHGLLASNAA